MTAPQKMLAGFGTVIALTSVWWVQVPDEVEAELGEIALRHTDAFVSVLVGVAMLWIAFTYGKRWK